MDARTPDYMAKEPVHRQYHHHDMTFGLLYAFSESFILPLSHDEVVHGKGSLIGKMPGDRWQSLPTCAPISVYVEPSRKKLLFMGGEFPQEREWNHDRELDWPSIDDPAHAASAPRRRLNGYRSEPALHQRDCDHPVFNGRSATIAPIRSSHSFAWPPINRRYWRFPI